MGKVKKPKPFGHNGFVAFDFYIGFDTVQVFPVRANTALYRRDFKKFKCWLDRVERYAQQELKAARAADGEETK